MAPISKPKTTLSQTFLREWRNFSDVSQQDAADAINVSRGLLSKIENARSPYLQQHIEGLAKLYNCDPADLLMRDPNDAGSLVALAKRADREATAEDKTQIASFIRFKLGLVDK